MTKRISKNLIQGKPFTTESFLKSFQKGGESAYSGFLGLKPVSIFGSQQWFRIARLINSRAIFETDRITEHEFESYPEMIKFLGLHVDMIEKLDDKTLLKYHVKNSAPGKPVYSTVGAIRKVLGNPVSRVKTKGTHVI